MQPEMYEWDDIWRQHADNPVLGRIAYIGDSISRSARDDCNKLANNAVLIDNFATSKALDNPYYIDTLKVFMAQENNLQAILFNNGLHGWHLDEREYENGYRDMLSYLTDAYDVPIYVVLTTCLPRDSVKNETVKKRNEVARKLAAEYQCRVIDLYTASVGLADMYNADGIHLNSDGAARLAEVLIQHLQHIINDGEKITFFGDSITFGIGASDNDHRYSTLVAKKLGAVEENLGISGTVMCTGGERSSRIDHVNNIPLDSAAVIVFLGVNDFDRCSNSESGMSYALGEFGTDDTTTIYGAAEVIYSRLYKRFENTDTRIYVCTPLITSWNSSVGDTRLWSKTAKNACGYTLRELCEAEIKVAEKYGFTVIDLNNNDKIQQSHFDDGLHPNDIGHKIVAEIIADAIGWESAKS